MHPTVSPRWLITAIITALASAVALGWLTLCLLFAQGSWQLLYHPAKPITHTPAEASLSYDSVGFNATPEGLPHLQAWWIPTPATNARTVLYLHGATGNLSDTIQALVPLHEAGLNIFAIDYRGFGQSTFARPSEEFLRADAEAALDYLANTRHISMANIILTGQGLGANLTLEEAAAHPNLAGVILEDPQADPTNAIFADPRAKLVPAHLLVRDRWNMATPAATLHIPSLWIAQPLATPTPSQTANPPAYDQVRSTKMLVWLPNPTAQPTAANYTRWLDQLPKAPQR